LTSNQAPSIIRVQKKKRGKQIMMNATRENLIDRMIRIYGFENDIVIQFAGLCERYTDNVTNDKMLTILVEAHEASPILDNEE
jgi:predicted glycosyltransferase